jgi:glycosyltransferase involved in cell wall biosynthesis
MARPRPVLLMVRALGHGGTERQVTELARSLDRSIFEPHVGCFLDDGFRAGELREAAIPILRMTMRGFVSGDSPRAFWKLRNYVHRHAIQLVHTFDYPMNIFGVPAARLLRVPVVLSSQRSYRSLIPSKYIPAIRFTDRLVNGIVVNCEAIRRHLADEYRVPDEKIRVCYNAIDTEQFHFLPRVRPPELRNASVVIGLVAVMRAIKGHATLLQAFAAIRAKIPGAKLVLVGSGPDENDIRQRAADLGISGDCLFHPSVQDVTPWLQAIDIFVLPTVSEALSNSLMEAMACGCCTIASRVGGNPELIQHGETGFLFEKSDVEDLAAQLLKSALDSGLRTSMGEKASEWITGQFTARRSVDAMQRVYEQFLG